MAKIESLRRPVDTPAAPPPRSPERENLATAIERHSAALTAVARVQEAKGRAREMWDSADDAIRTAKAAFEEAKAAEPRRLVDRLLGNTDEGGITAEAAADALARAEADERKAREACQLLDGELSLAKKEVEHAKRHLNDAVRAVVRSDAARATAVVALAAARNQFEEAFAIVALLEHASFMPGDRSDLLAPDINGYREPPHEWAVAIERLRTDADALLPPLAG